MPLLYILAGPNGTGKTTFYQNAVLNKTFSKELPFVNVDTIARQDLGGYTEENYVRASDIARERITVYIQQKADFMIESNLAKSTDFDWLLNMQKAGYDVILYFLCTNNILINIDRVERRLKEGGHFIPAHIIRDRYNLCFMYLKSRLSIFSFVIW